MTKLALHSIKVPKVIKINIENNILYAYGQYGNIRINLPNFAKIEFIHSEICVLTTSTFSKSLNKQLGTLYANIKNGIVGISLLHQKRLIINGTGYKFSLNSENLQVQVGFSNTLKFTIPKDISVSLESPTILCLSSMDIVHLGNFCSKIKNTRPINVYTNYGIRYDYEVLKKKIGKKSK